MLLFLRIQFLSAAVVIGVLWVIGATDGVARSESIRLPVAELEGGGAADAPNAAEEPAVDAAPRAIRTLSLHQGPNAAYSVLGTLPRGALLSIVGRDEAGEWLAIALGIGSTLYGWVPVAQVAGVTDVQSLAVASANLVPAPEQPPPPTAPARNPNRRRR